MGNGIPDILSLTRTVLLLASWSASDLLNNVVFPVIILLSVALALHYGVAAWHRYSVRRVERQKRAEPMRTAPPVDELKVEIQRLDLQLAEYRNLLVDLARKIDEYHRDESTGAAKLQQTVREANRKILESIYSEVNKATGASLGAVLDSIKGQIRDVKNQLNKQIQDLAGLITAAREQPKETEPGKAAGNISAPSAQELAVVEKEVLPVAQEPPQPLMENRLQNNHPVVHAPLANVAHSVAKAAEELEIEPTVIAGM